MPWKDGYTTSDEKSLADRQVIWPDGKQCAYVLVIDLSVASGPEGITPADLTTAASQFSTQVGLRSLLDVLQHFGITATFAVPAVIAEISPTTVETIMAHGHEVAAHGFKHEDVSQLNADQERERLEAATASLTRITGQRPAGCTAPACSATHPWGLVKWHRGRGECLYGAAGRGHADDRVDDPARVLLWHCGGSTDLCGLWSAGHAPQAAVL